MAANINHRYSTLCPNIDHLIAADAQHIYRVIEAFEADYSDDKIIQIPTSTAASSSSIPPSTAITLGPRFSPEAFSPARAVVPGHPDFKSLFPLLDETPAIFNRDMQAITWKGPQKPINGWSGVYDAWLWFERLEQFHPKWTQNRLMVLIRIACTSNLHLDRVSAEILTKLWHPCYNCFALPRGFQTVTLEDLALIAGLSPEGLTPPCAEGVRPEAVKLFDRAEKWFQIDVRDSNIAYGTLVSRFVGPRRQEITPLEEVLD